MKVVHSCRSRISKSLGNTCIVLWYTAVHGVHVHADTVKSVYIAPKNINSKWASRYNYTKNPNCSLSWRLNYSGAYKYGCSVQIQREFLCNKHHEILIPVEPGATYSGKKKKPL